MTLDLEAGRRAGTAKVREFKQRRQQSEQQPSPEPEHKPNGAPPPLRSFYWTLDDITNLEGPSWLIQDLLPQRAKTLTFGESGHFKSLHAVDACCRLAHGIDYHGLAVLASHPVCFIVNEDAYGFAVQRVQGWQLYHGRKGGRIIVLPCNTKLDNPEDLARAIACAQDAFGENNAPVFVIDTWDRSISGNPNSTEDVNPALDGLDRLLNAGVATWTISHSPWSDKNRSKGAVTFWANHDARIKAEKHQATGRGTLEVLHQKNARAGLMLSFDFERFNFKHRGEPIDTLIPVRVFDCQQPAANKPPALGKNERIVLAALRTAIADQADMPPPDPRIPQHVKGSSIERWQAVAVQSLPQQERKRRNQAFERASLSLIADRHVQHLLGFAWVP